jgi:hypothetical protein
MKYDHRVGERAGSLVFEGIEDVRGDNNRLLGRFRCDCGNAVIFAVGRVLNAGSKTHCGCQTDHGAHRTHGMRGSPEYRSWQAMKSRCLDPANKDYPRWGGRGVTIHPDWIVSFEAFFASMGQRPAGTSLDRIDNSRGYEPGNCRWATPAEQQANRRDTWVVSIDGREFPSAEAAAAAFGVSTTTIGRWCDGFFDSRRSAQRNGGFTPAKPGCRRWRKYAA